MEVDVDGRWLGRQPQMAIGAGLDAGAVSRRDGKVLGLDPRSQLLHGQGRLLFSAGIGDSPALLQ